MTYNYKTRINRLQEAFNFNQIFLSEISQKYYPYWSYLENIFQDDIYNSSYNDSQTLNWAVFMYISHDWTIERKKEREKIIFLLLIWFKNL